MHIPGTSVYFYFYLFIYFSRPISLSDFIFRRIYLFFAGQLFFRFLPWRFHLRILYRFVTSTCRPSLSLYGLCLFAAELLLFFRSTLIFAGFYFIFRPPIIFALVRCHSSVALCCQHPLLRSIVIPSRFPTCEVSLVELSIIFGFVFRFFRPAFQLYFSTIRSEFSRSYFNFNYNISFY